MVDSLVTVPHSAKGRGLIDWFLNKKITQWICNTGVGSAWAMMWTATTVHTVLRTWIDWFLQKFVYTWWMLDLYPRCGFCVMCWELDWLISSKVWLHMMNVGSVPQVLVLRDVLRTGLIDFSKSLVTHDECWLFTPGVGSAWCAENLDWSISP